MSKILVVGNVIKDVYLNLDAERNNFEMDDAGVNWLDLSFDGSKHNFFKRTAVFGGVKISQQIIESFHHKVKLTAEGQPASDYRYILCKDHQIAYLAPDEHKKTIWQAPIETYDWIYVDRSANVSVELAQNILAYMAISPRTRLAYYAHANMNSIEESLARVSMLVFADDSLKKQDIPGYQGLFCHISMNNIVIEGVEQSWRQTQTRTGLMTHLTLYSVIAGTVFAALTDGRNIRDALLLAKINVENATLNTILPLEKLDQMVMEYQKNLKNLRLIADSIVSKGILAADESGGSIHKKFEQAGIPDDEAHRRDYRNIFFTTKELEKYVSGVILFDETARQRADDGSNFVDFLTSKGIIPGIKVDQGLANFPDSDEKYTKGLDGLPERLEEYHEMGLRFAKWRAAFEVVPPSDMAIQKNCEILAQYAKDCQDALIVPIVEPEVVHDGNYSVEVCAEVTGKILDELFRQLVKKHVDLSACILKCSMVLAGKQHITQSAPEEVGQMTAATLRAHVPAELAGVVFLSGGQGVEQATSNLQQVINNGPFPWPVTFSFARALQGPALDVWQGNNENAERARTAFHTRLVANADALIKR